MPKSVEEFKQAFAAILSRGPTTEPELDEEEKRQAARAPVAIRATVVSGWAAARSGIRGFGNKILADDELVEVEGISKQLKVLQQLIPDEKPLLALVDSYEKSDESSRDAARVACRSAAAKLLDHIEKDERLELLETSRLGAAGVVPPLVDALTSITTALA